MSERLRRYWILTTEFPPQFGGGIGTYVWYTSRMLQTRGHEVTVFLCDISISEEKVNYQEGIRVIRFSPYLSREGEALGYQARVSYSYAAIVKKYIELESVPDILESQEYQAIAYYVQQFKALGYKGFKDLSILITCHAPSFLCLEYNHVPIYEFPQYWTGEMEKSSIRQADLLISPSRYFVKEAKKRMCWEKVEEHYLPNPIELNNEPSIGYRENYIVSFGKLSPLKGSFELLNYFSRLWEDGFNHPLHIIGGVQQLFHPEGESMGDLLQKKYSRFIEEGLLVFDGDLPPEEAHKKIREAQVVIVASLFDNLPYTVLEAMCAGKIVLASVQGGQREILIDGYNGFLFDHEVHGDFENKLRLILRKSKAELEQIAHKAIQSVRQFCSPEIIYEKKIKIIRDYFRSSSTKRKITFTHPLGEPPLLPRVNNSDNVGLLSVVIPYYNMAEFIQETIESILNAEYRKVEVLIIDDGSNDPASIEKLIELEKRFPVKVLHKHNEGLALARNYGAMHANGEYLAFLDADDTVDPGYYTKSISVLEENEHIFFVGCWAQYFGMSKGIWPTFNPEPPYLLVHNMINSSALVYKKEAFLQAGLNKKQMTYGMEDWESVISLVEKNYRGVVLPEPLFNYRVRKNSMSRAFTKVKQLHLNRLIGESHRTLYSRYGFEITQLLLANGSGLNFDNPTVEQDYTLQIGGVAISGKVKERLKMMLKKNRLARQLAYRLYKQVKNR